MRVVIFLVVACYLYGAWRMLMLFGTQEARQRQWQVWQRLSGDPNFGGERSWSFVGGFAVGIALAFLLSPTFLVWDLYRLGYRLVRWDWEPWL